jgi:leucyl-tRNA synthetase
MIATNELITLKCNKRQILEPMTILLSSYAPHITEELWSLLGNDTTIFDTSFPILDESYLKEDNYEYPVSVNGKMRVKISFPVDMNPSEIEKLVLANEAIIKWTEGKTPKKVIIIPKKIVNVVI